MKLLKTNIDINSIPGIVLLLLVCSRKQTIDSVCTCIALLLPYVANQVILSHLDWNVSPDAGLSSPPVDVILASGECHQHIESLVKDIELSEEETDKKMGMRDSVYIFSFISDVVYDTQLIDPLVNVIEKLMR